MTMSHKHSQETSPRRTVVNRKQGWKPKTCLKCDRSFLSEGPHNWLCHACRELIKEAPSPEETFTIGNPNRSR